MVLNDNFKNEILDCYFLNDQPMTCGTCGSRTTFDCGADGVQKHQCLNKDCGYKFIAVDDVGYMDLLES